MTVTIVVPNLLASIARISVKILKLDSTVTDAYKGVRIQRLTFRIYA